MSGIDALYGPPFSSQNVDIEELSIYEIQSMTEQCLEKQKEKEIAAYLALVHTYKLDMLSS